MFAIIIIKNHQYFIKKNMIFKVNHLKENEKGSILEIDKVLLFKYKQELRIGKPFLENIKIKLEILEHFKNKKINILKFKRRKKYSRKIGHRQKLTRLKVNNFIIGD